jgi:hypothetical protein
MSEIKRIDEYYIKYQCPKCGLIEYYVVLPIGRETTELNDRFCLKDGSVCIKSLGNFVDNQDELAEAQKHNRIKNI